MPGERALIPEMLIAQSRTGTNRRQGIHPARNLGIARQATKQGEPGTVISASKKVHGTWAESLKMQSPKTFGPHHPFLSFYPFHAFVWSLQNALSKAGTSLPKPQRPPNPASEYRMYLPALIMLVLCSCPSCHPAALGRYKYRRCFWSFCKNPGTTTLRQEHPASPLTTSCLQTGTCGRYDRGRACSLLTPTPTPAAGIYGHVSLLHPKLTDGSSRRRLNSSPSLMT